MVPSGEEVVRNGSKGGPVGNPMKLGGRPYIPSSEALPSSVYAPDPNYPLLVDYDLEKLVVNVNNKRLKHDDAKKEWTPVKGSLSIVGQ